MRLQKKLFLSRFRLEDEEISAYQLVKVTLEAGRGNFLDFLLLSNRLKFDCVESIEIPIKTCQKWNKVYHSFKKSKEMQRIF